MNRLSDVQIINASFQIWGCVLSLLLLFCLSLTKRYQSKAEKYYLGIIGLNMAVMAFDAIALYFRGGEGRIADIGVRAANVLSFTCGAALTTVFMFYVIAYLEAKWQKKIKYVYRHIAIGMLCLNLAMLTINLFRPFLYRIGSNNLYQRMEFYPLVLIPNAMILLAVSVLLIHHWKELDNWEKIPFMTYILAPIIGMIGTALVYGIVFAQIGSMGAILIMFVFLEIEQSKNLVRKERELSQSKIDIAMSQIRPHFLYNTLGTLSALCKKDPYLASEAMDNFAIYFRQNMESINRSMPIPFEDELAHIKNYIGLEKLRFGEDIQISYDIQTDEFQVPAISIQPMVENAILHGMMGRDGVCHIQLITRNVEDGAVEIIIKDDGVGFDTSKQKNDGKSHIGISNVRKRIEMMMNGTLQVESIPEMGTKVTIRIPKECT